MTPGLGLPLAAGVAGTLLGSVGNQTNAALGAGSLAALAAALQGRPVGQVVGLGVLGGLGGALGNQALQESGVITPLPGGGVAFDFPGLDPFGVPVPGFNTQEGLFFQGGQIPSGGLPALRKEKAGGGKDKQTQDSADSLAKAAFALQLVNALVPPPITIAPQRLGPTVVRGAGIPSVASAAQQGLGQLTQRNRRRPAFLFG